MKRLHLYKKKAFVSPPPFIPITVVECRQKKGRKWPKSELTRTDFGHILGHETAFSIQDYSTNMR